MTVLTFINILSYIYTYIIIAVFFDWFGKYIFGLVSGGKMGQILVPFLATLLVD